MVGSETELEGPSEEGTGGNRVCHLDCHWAWLTPHAVPFSV